MRCTHAQIEEDLRSCAKILLVRDHARKRKEPFHVNIKVSKLTCAKFVVGRLIDSRRFQYVIDLWDLIRYRNTRRLRECV